MFGCARRSSSAFLPHAAASAADGYAGRDAGGAGLVAGAAAGRHAHSATAAYTPPANLTAPAFIA